MNDARQQFEAIISAPPYELSTKRFPDDHAVWPGCYKDYHAHLAWGLYKQGRKDMQAQAAQACVEEKWFEGGKEPCCVNNTPWDCKQAILALDGDTNAD